MAKIEEYKVVRPVLAAQFDGLGPIPGTTFIPGRKVGKGGVAPTLEEKTTDGIPPAVGDYGVYDVSGSLLRIVPRAVFEAAHKKAR